MEHSFTYRVYDWFGRHAVLVTVALVAGIITIGVAG